VEEAQRRDDLRRLVEDVGRLPEQQRSALLMREIDGMTYAELAAALDVTVPAVKSLLVRARVGLVEAIEARDADCAEIRADLLRSYDRGVKASGRARRHMRSCHGCREYRGALRGMRRSFAALTPVGAGPLAFAAKLIGLGGAGGGAAAGGSAAAGGGAAAVSGGGLAVGGGVATATACKVAAVVCATALAGGAVEVKREISHRPAHKHAAAAAHPRPAATSAAASVVTVPHLRPRHVFAPPLVVHRIQVAAPAKPAHKHQAPPRLVATPAPTPASTADPSATDISAQTGGALAPAASPPVATTPVPAATPAAVAPPVSGTPEDGTLAAAAGTAPADPAAATGAAAAPPAAAATSTPTPPPGR